MNGEQAVRVITVSPFSCRMWPLHDRIEDHISEDSCRQEIESFVQHGQLVPVLGRSLVNDPTHDVELIFGARRLFVARHLNLPLRVEVKQLSDRQAIVAMDIENRQRQDISAYERGLSYARWLREGFFSSQEDIARALRISAAQVSRLLKIAKLPAVVVGAFSSPTEIRESWGLELASALEDAERRPRIVNKAREICERAERPPSCEVSRLLLLASTHGRKPAVRRHDEVKLDASGRPLFRVRHARTSVMLLLPASKVSAKRLSEICSAVTSLLE